MLFVEDVFTPGIVGAAVELAVFPVPQDLVSTAVNMLWRVYNEPFVSPLIT